MTNRAFWEKAVLEKLFEDRLKARKGYKISIVDAEGSEKEALAMAAPKDGENITLTIDGHLQQSVYEQYKNDKSSSIVMNLRQVRCWQWYPHPPSTAWTLYWECLRRNGIP